jgi:hypothetical protein
MNTTTDNDTTISPAPTDTLQPWLSAAYSRPTSIISKYNNIIFTPQGESRVAQIAGWIVGLVHGGQRELAAKIAADITRQFEYLNTYGGEAEGFTFSDGSPVTKLRRYMVQLGDDGTFGGFTVGWYRVVTMTDTQSIPPGRLLQSSWGGTFDTTRWNITTDPDLRESQMFRYQYSMNGGLLYHGPGGGETFSVTIGDVRFWSIHT